LTNAVSVNIAFSSALTSRPERYSAASRSLVAAGIGWSEAKRNHSRAATNSACAG
jgi:hypothetical protein